MTDNSGTPVPPRDPSSPPSAAPYQGEYGSGAYNSPSGAEDPGKTLGIVGLVLAFLLAPAGLVVSIIGKVKSKKAGFKNGFATAGIIVSIALIVISIIAIVLVSVSLGAAVTELVEACAGVPTGETVEVEGVPVTCP